ncbi:hypothetical protein GJ744_006096 [Endocarpon pusillum]|uniref:Uncharacterized protein n=1 Tax=Endocarpon pusillum TaxID=364733 RepID=A0A8H7E6Z7_9EURO|nr:hypothetical protein GJ744_006096 [Endocarpon pusillum]
MGLGHPALSRYLTNNLLLRNYPLPVRARPTRKNTIVINSNSGRLQNCHQIIMQIAMILSDLKSLSVCGHEEALNLVNVHRSTSISTKDAPGTLEATARSAAYEEKTKNNPDLQRAKDLAELHYRVKLKYQEEGLDPELQQAREDINRVYRSLSRQSSR